MWHVVVGVVGGGVARSVYRATSRARTTPISLVRDFSLGKK